MEWTTSTTQLTFLEASAWGGLKLFTRFSPSSNLRPRNTAIWRRKDNGSVKGNIQSAVNLSSASYGIRARLATEMLCVLWIFLTESLGCSQCQLRQMMLGQLLITRAEEGGISSAPRGGGRGRMQGHPPSFATEFALIPLLIMRESPHLLTMSLPHSGR